MRAAPTLLLTVGHGAATEDDFRRLLQAAGVASVVDVRIGPGSRKHPHFGKARLEEWLPESGIAYRWEQRLGGFRKPSPDSPDTVWRNASFRGYAAHTRSPEFVAAVDELAGQAARERTAVMCSESVWWRCHRRLIAELLHARDHEVIHLLKLGHRDRHRPWEPISQTRENVLHLCGEPVA